MDDKNTLLASLAVFRKLYDADKDIYIVISAFLKDLIQTQKLYNFSLSEIHEKFNTAYEFDIPREIIRTSLGRLNFINHQKEKYEIPDISKVNVSTFDEEQKQIIEANKKIIDSLCSYIENEKDIILDFKEKQIVTHNFCNFLLDKNNGNKYLEHISTFLIENEKDGAFSKQLNLIKEGIILYTGIKFNNNLSEVGSWKSEMLIYLETDILFDIAGFNGELYKNIIFDLLELIDEINKKAKKSLIRLRYFDKTKTEIDKFFKKAEFLLQGKECSNPEGTAMNSILNGCSSTSDIVSKEADFYSLLGGKGIYKDDYDEYFKDYNYKYNVINSELVENVNATTNKDSTDCLKSLNFIAIHRKGKKACNFEDVGCILLTENSSIVKVAWNDLVKDSQDVPLATHIGFLTNKFWFKLNKGLGDNSLPKSFDIITKAQLLLSKELNNTVGGEYAKLQEDFDKGKLTETQASERILYLKNKVVKPEEIKEDNVRNVLSVITEDNLKRLAEEQSISKINSERNIAENIKLKKELEEKKLDNNVLENKVAEMSKQMDEFKKNNNDKVNMQKELVYERVRVKIIRSKIKDIFFIISLTIICSLLVLKFGSDLADKWIVILTGIFTISIPSIYTIINRKRIKYSERIARREKKYISKICRNLIINEDLFLK